MNTKPTVIVLAEPPSDAARVPHDTDGAMSTFNALDTTLRRVLASGLPMLLVAPADQAAAAVDLVPSKDILVVPSPPTLQPRADWLVGCMAVAVMTRPQASGWLLLPADMPMLQCETLLTLADSLPRQGPIVFPCHRHRRGHPVAFSAELYSELVRLGSEQDLRRLAARYPSVDLEVDDPGIHLALEARAGLSQLRAQLTGASMHLGVTPARRPAPHRHS